MKLDDFSFADYTSFGRAIILNTVQDAKKLDKFLDSQDIIEVFNEHGPGKYVVMYNEGWDRNGDYKMVTIRFVDYNMSLDETLNQLKSLKKTYDNAHRPFSVAEKLNSLHKTTGKPYDECVAMLSTREQKVLKQMNWEVADVASVNLENFLNGFI